MNGSTCGAIKLNCLLASFLVAGLAPALALAQSSQEEAALAAEDGDESAPEPASSSDGETLGAAEPEEPVDLASRVRRAVQWNQKYFTCARIPDPHFPFAFFRSLDCELRTVRGYWGGGWRDADEFDRALEIELDALTPMLAEGNKRGVERVMKSIREQAFTAGRMSDGRPLHFTIVPSGETIRVYDVESILDAISIIEHALYQDS
ncbi:MAG: hypothetical protein HY554_01195 [Elusimicrobia bacterium]|nr:hypothetical protein [Elusimicrobiota bacterium]